MATETTKRTGFEGGLWIIPALTTIGGIIFTILGLKASHSGSTQQLPNGSIVVSEENVGFFQTIGILGPILFAVTIVIVLMMRSER